MNTLTYDFDTLRREDHLNKQTTNKQPPLSSTPLIRPYPNWRLRLRLRLLPSVLLRTTYIPQRMMTRKSSRSHLAVVASSDTTLHWPNPHPHPPTVVSIALKMKPTKCLNKTYLQRFVTHRTVRMNSDCERFA